MSQSKTQVPTISTFNFDNFKLSQKGNTNSKYGFTKFKLEYDFGTVSSRTCLVKLENVKVAKIFKPTGESAAPKHTVLFDIQDKEQVAFLGSIQSFVEKQVYDNQEKYGVSFDDEDDLADCFPTKLCSSNSQYNSNTLATSFSFNTNNAKDIDVVYYEDDVDSDARQSRDLENRLGSSSVCDIFLELVDLTRNDENQEFKIKASIFGKINVREYSNESSSSSGGGIYVQNLLEDVNLDDVVLGEPETNKYSSRFAKPKHRIGGKEKALVCSFEDTTVTFLTTVAPDSGKQQFNIVMNLTDEQADKFDAIGGKLMDGVFENHKKYLGKDPPKKKDNFDKKVKSCVKRSEQYGTNIWFSVYAREKSDSPGRFEFDNKFYRSDGSQYTDDEVQDTIFGRRDQTVSLLNVFFKHLWFGKSYSDKWQLSGVKVDIHNEFDLDGPEPPQQTETSTNSDNTSDDGNDSDHGETETKEKEPSSASSSDDDGDSDRGSDSDID